VPKAGANAVRTTSSTSTHIQARDTYAHWDDNIPAPISGSIDAIGVTDGATIDPGTTIEVDATGSDIDFFHYVFDGVDGGMDSAADDVTYTWDVSDANGDPVDLIPGVPGPQTDGPGAGDTFIWFVPTTPSTYTLTCTIDDVAAMSTGDQGRRDDAPVVCTFTVTVPPKTWSTDSAMAATLDPMTPINLPTVAAPGSIVTFTATGSDSDHWIQGSAFGDTADTVGFAWAAIDENNQDAGAPAPDTSGTVATWMAPLQPGFYKVTCTVDDAAVTDETDAGTRKDGPLPLDCYVIVPPKNWSNPTGIVTDAGVTPQMTLPVEPNGPGSVLVPTNDTVSCVVEESHDVDHWDQADQSGDEDDIVTYDWTAQDSNGQNAGSFTDGDTLTAQWHAPATPGTYTLTCTIDDVAATDATDIGSRDDAAVVLTRQVTVAQIGSLQYVDATNLGATYQPVPEGGLVVPKDSQLRFQAAPLPASLAWPADQPVWDGSFGALGSGPSSPTLNLTTPGAYTITATYGNGQSGAGATGNAVEAHITVVAATLSPESTRLKLNTQTSLTGTVDPPTALDQVRWVSADPTIAGLTVTPVEGAAPQLTITGNSLGTTVVQARLGEGANAPVLATVQVWVNKYGLDSNEVVVQPDGRIRDAGSSTWTGCHLRDTTVTLRQSVQQTVSAGATAVYEVMVHNDNLSEFNTGSDNLTVTGPGDSAGWSVHYFDALTGGTDITTQITGTGWPTGTLAEGASHPLRVEVTPDADLTDPTPLTVAVTATTGFASGEQDVVAGVTQAQLRPTGLSATADDQRQIALHWNAVAGATAYRVYESPQETSGYTMVAEVNGTTHLRTDRLNATTYLLL
jgi:plastocyanin